MKYGVRLQGDNYEIRVEEQWKLLGFVTTRFVKASSIEDAEKAALDLILKDPHLNNLMRSNSEHIAKVHVTEMWSEKWWKRTGGKGYSFFPMEEDGQI
ncbi:hypothetical protein R50072_36700 [Simiduia litorea]|uniref:hypothetical protein n=1 Tax=Simiduia litorea TaxID=1435348 RepID=UPI0036F1E83C